MILYCDKLKMCTVKPKITIKITQQGFIAKKLTEEIG